MRPRRHVVIEVTDAHVLVPRSSEPEREPLELTPEVLAAIDGYADQVVSAAAPMDAETRAEVAALLRARAPQCTGRARHDARDMPKAGRSEPAA
jgi:uncharacterized protein (DUF2342 family)